MLKLTKSIKSSGLIFIAAVIISQFFYLEGNANQNTIDSLLNELKVTQNDSIKIDVYLKIAKEWERKNLDTTLANYGRAMEIATKNNWPGRMGQINVNIAFSHYYNGNRELVIEHMQKGLELYEQAGDKASIMNTEYNLGYFYGTYEYFPEAIQQFKKVIPLAKELEHNERLAGAYNNLGLVYNYSGLFDKATEYQFKALELAEHIGENTAYIHMNIALNYSESGDQQKSLEYNKKSAKSFQEMDIPVYVAQAYKAMGDNYSNMFMLDSAEYFYNKAYTIFKELDDQESIARHHMVIGIVSDKRGLHQKAESQYKLALKTIPKDGNKKLRFAIHSNLCELYLLLADESAGNKLHLLSSTIKYAKEMLKTANEFEAIDMQTKAYNFLYRAYEKIGNQKTALSYANKYILAKDSLFSEQKQKAIAEMQTKYETEKKELEIQVLNSENELISSRLTQQRSIIFILIAGFLIVGVLLITIFYYYRQTKNKNKQLIEQNAIILKQKEEKEMLVKEIHHRTKNNLQIISSLFDLQMRSTENPEIRASLIDGLNRVKSVGLIHELLYKSEDVMNIGFEEFVKKLMEHLTSFSSEKPIKQTISIPENLYFDIKTTLPLGLIINELMTNAFKYAFKKIETCNVSVILEKRADTYHLEIKDNGTGLPKEFDFQSSKSLGLRLVRTLSEQLNGKIDYSLDQGAKFLLTFPVE